MTGKKIRKEYQSLIYHSRRLERALMKAAFRENRSDAARTDIVAIVRTIQDVRRGIDKFWEPEIGRMVAEEIRVEVVRNL